MVSADSLQRIGALAEAYSQRVASSDPLVLAAYLDVPVQLHLFAATSTKGGFLVRHDGQWAIIVNRRRAPVRRRVTIAHECGHYILHRTTWRTGIVPSERWEREANRFAVAYLMPTCRVLDGIARHGRDPVALATAWGLSAHTISLRLRELGW